ncbi:hypothetical protein L0663_25835 [Dyadobacter sp. CY107]|uniref:hypothetical protein n=1 Tax=Dyadobacter fanqingshengii TaxID=2906443 RepID=UPI001F33C793|nr:hypothetical protein [Dyadobacter fanqingshengii]MCF2506837.1 hypothetical protein [Dyadobacter fanqingshengii]
MIRNKLDCNAHMSPSDVVVRNQKYFEKAGISVNQQHECRCGRSEYHEAAEMLLFTLKAEGSDPGNFPMWQKGPGKTS